MSVTLQDAATPARPPRKLSNLAARLLGNRASVPGPVEAIAATHPGETGRSTERRTAPRCPASLVPAITGLRLSPCGGDTTLVDISATGLLLKSDTKLSLGASVTVIVDGTFSPSSIASRVARCAVSEIDANGVLWYHVGAVFNEPIEFDPALASNLEPLPPPCTSSGGRTVRRNRW